MSQCLNPDCLNKNPDGTQFCQKCGSKLLLREHYRAIKKIGEGGFGRTFLAIDEDRPSKPYCVIKQFLPQAQGTNNVQKASELFEQEAVRLDDLGRKHDQIPDLFAYFTQDNRQYLVQEYIEGKNLADELTDNGVFNESEIRSLLVDLLEVLQFIHHNQVIHRDIKPENIIRRHRDGKLVLVDFGSAKYTTRTALGVTGTVIGSAEYVAPEQSRGKAIFASDLYSLGVTCINLLTSVSPFDLYDISENDWVWRQYLVNNSVSDELGQVLDKLIEVGTKKRYQSAVEVLQALNPTPKTKVPSPQPVSPLPTRRLKPALLSLKPDEVKLRSEKGVDYTKLRVLLAARSWKDADRETDDRMLQAMMKKNRWDVEEEDILNFPCADLCTINSLWLKYSNGKFGFSVQKDIWIEVGGTPGEWDYDIYKKFADRNGWRKGGDWLSYSELTFNTNALRGHLPFYIAQEWTVRKVSLLSHYLFWSTEACNL